MESGTMGVGKMTAYYRPMTSISGKANGFRKDLDNVSGQTIYIHRKNFIPSHTYHLGWFLAIFRACTLTQFMLDAIGWSIFTDTFQIHLKALKSSKKNVLNDTELQPFLQALVFSVGSSYDLQMSPTSHKPSRHIKLKRASTLKRGGCQTGPRNRKTTHKISVKTVRKFGKNRKTT